MTSSSQKVFGIGLSKTGTTSLAHALAALGYRTRDNMGVVKYAAGDLSSIDLAVVDAHDALTDTPIPSFYRELDVTYPGSKFILTVRDREGWLKSCKKQFTQPHAARQHEAHKRLFIDLYGTDVFDGERFGAGYTRFVEGVRDYFKDRPEDLLILNVSAGEGWEKLCGFLDRPIPEIPFPKANVTQITWMSIDDVVAVARRAGVELMQRYDGHREMDARSERAQLALAYKGRRLLAAAAQVLMGKDTTHVAITRAHKVIVSGLTKLNPQIPVLSRESGLVPYADRRQWNHCWLIDPLDGEEAFVRGSNDFSINIALIQDGRPIYGVVHAPASDTTYYGTAKGGYRRTGDAEAIPLGRDPSLGQPAPAARGAPEEPDGAVRSDRTSSHGLAICHVSEGLRSAEAVTQPSMEWQTAAGDAILRSAGRRLWDCESGAELRYNKKDLRNGVIKVV